MIRVFLIIISSFIFSCSGGPKIQVDGSSTVYPITEIMAEEFEGGTPGVSAVIGESGTGGGFKKFARREIDIANASRPISKKENTLCEKNGIEYLEIPVAFDGLAVVVNPENTWANEITVEELKIIWSPEAQNKITRWNQVRSTWPNEKINLYGAGTASGTFDYFTEAIVGKAKSCRGDYTASEDDNILVQGVSTDKFALGFFGFHYYIANKEKLKVLPVDDQKEENGKGGIIPSETTIMDASYQPLSRPLFIYIRKESLSNPAVKQFALFFTEKASTFIPETGYIPLPAAIYAKVNARIQNNVVGSPYLKLKTSVGVKLDEVYK